MLSSLLITLLLAYAGFAALLFLFQDKLAYYPQMGREVIGTPREHGLEFEALTLVASDGVRLDAWFVPAPRARGVVLFLHGNAGNISHRMDSIAMIHRLGHAVLIFDYRGYGRSGGKPSEAGLARDADAAWAYLTGQRGIAPGHVILFGESLGGAVAAELAARQAPEARPGALVLASVFTSVPDLAADLYPWLPARWLARMKYDTAAALARIQIPVLIAHSPDDEIVPFRHGRRLYALVSGPKVFLELAGGHNDGFIFMRPDWVESLAGFFREHVER